MTQEIVLNAAVSENEFLEIRGSSIHRCGAFARKLIPKGTRIIEYLGVKISEEESKRIEAESFDRHDKDRKNNAGTYVFQVDESVYLDGDIPENTAKYINHSCNPNCEVNIVERRVWIDALRDINEGEEIAYNYGFDIDESDPEGFKRHPCCCGSERCVGYILAEDEWPRMKELLAKKI